MKQKVSLLDSCFLQIDTANTHQVIAALGILSSSPDMQALHTRMESVIKVFPRLRNKVVRKRSSYYWEEDNSFSLANHLRYLTLSDITDEKDLLQSAEKYFSQGLDLNKPLWSFTVLINHQNTINKAPFVGGFLFCIHHALADGLGALELLHAILDPPLHQHTQGRTLRNNTPRRKIFSTGKSLFRLFREHQKRREETLLHGNNSSNRQFAIVTFDLYELNRLRKHVGITLNDLYLGLISYAMRLYHQHHGSVVNELCAIIPINLRSFSERLSLGNRLTAMGVKLPSHISGIENQLRLIREQLRKLYTSGAFGAMLFVAKISAFFPPSIRRKLYEAQAKRTNFICTTVPGSSQMLTLCGIPVTRQFAFPALLKEHGISFSLFSYAMKANISLVSDPAIFPDPDLFIRCIEEAKSALLAAVEEEQVLVANA